jgi:hypothetical protein
MRTMILRLEDAGVTEDTIVEHLKIMHKEVRSKLKNPVESLTISCRAEIQLNDDYVTTNKTLAAQYRTSDTEIYKARYLTLPRKHAPTREQVLMAWHEGYHTVKELAKTLSSQEKPVRAILTAEGLANPAKQTTVSRGVRPAMLNEIMKGVSYSIIAEQFDCSISTVSELAIAHGHGRQYQNKPRDDWPEILEYAAEHTVSKAASHYGVERSNIYYHMNK